MKIACIGSRKITPALVPILEDLGEFIVKQGWLLGSGNATGSDQAYARGGNRIDPRSVMLYLPWWNYEKQAIKPGNQLVLNHSKYYDLAKAHHPKWKTLTRGVQYLMLRNAGIVSESVAVLAVLDHAKVGGGGTGHGWRIAKTLGIPRFDLSKPQPEIKYELERICSMAV